MADRLFTRAGGNFSAISGNDANALKWDRAGYLEMWKLVESKSAEARFLAKTKSTEYFDKSPDADKVNSMSTYLKDVSASVALCASSRDSDALASSLFSLPKLSRLGLYLGSPSQRSP